MQVIKEGSVRVDLLGGTLDLHPLQLILSKVVTLNLATKLKAKVCLKSEPQAGVTFISKDYQTKDFFSKEELLSPELIQGPLAFVARICSHCGLTENMTIELSSGSPPGSGLGGSSAMGVTLYSAILDYQARSIELEQVIKATSDMEAIQLGRGPAGYQDYYPALYGGILALKARVGGTEVEQLYSTEWRDLLESQLCLIHTNETRNSGINNWEVYKGFFDGDVNICRGLSKIAELSFEAYQLLKGSQDKQFVDLIWAEGEARERLFPGLLSPKMKEFKRLSSLPIKVCGAGGGGCFLTAMSKELKILCQQLNLTLLPFEIDAPLADV